MKKRKNSFMPLRRSVVLITTAILLSTSANAELPIGRLPSSLTISGQGNAGSATRVKPNVFLIIDNSSGMAGNGGKNWAPTGSRLQNVAAALIASLPKLEDKVRLGYTTVFPGFQSVSRLTKGKYSCSQFKLNGNFKKIDPEIQAAVRKNNHHYFTGDDDFVFGEYGSGRGNLVPRDFTGNFASYIYSWLGGMCVGDTATGSETPPDSSNQSPRLRGAPAGSGFPPYADLSQGKNNYQQAARAAKNPYSFPLSNWQSNNLQQTTYNPLIDIYGMVLAMVSSNNVCGYFGVLSPKTNPRQCGLTDISGNNSSQDSALRYYPNSNVNKYFSFDAYAPTVASKNLGSRLGNVQNFGFPDDKNPLSCRKNYTLMISYGDYGFPKYVSANTNTGVGGYGIDGQGSYYGQGWKLPAGSPVSAFPAEGSPDYPYTRIYRFFATKKNGRNDGLLDMKSFMGGNQLQGAGASFSLAKLALTTYYKDLRPDLPNNVPPYYVSDKLRNQGINGAPIPKFWDRKNDPANWQHMTFFALAFAGKRNPNDPDYIKKVSSYASWRYASERYLPNYPDLLKEAQAGKDPGLEPYFRAVEDGTIYDANTPLPDWGRGGFGLAKAGINHYFYKPLSPKNAPLKKVEVAPEDPHGDEQLRAFGAYNDMDYAKAGMIGRGGAFNISDDYKSIESVINAIAKTIDLATTPSKGITGGALSGGGRVTASQQSAGGNDSVLFTTYEDESTLSGNVFAFKNCPLVQEKIEDKSSPGNYITNPEWTRQHCGQRLWNAATVLSYDAPRLGAKTIIPVKSSGGAEKGAYFDWNNLDDELKKALKNGGSDALGQARVEWVNGKLQSDFSKDVQGSLRKRSQVAIPDEQQSYAVDKNGNLIKDANGNIVKAKPTSITNFMGEVVYATPKAVDNRGTLPAAHPLNDEKYANFVNGTVKKRKPLVLAGSNDGHLYGFNNSSDSSNASLAFSFIPRYVVTKSGNNLADFTTNGVTTNSLKQGLVNGQFSVKDALINGKWGTYVVGTLGQGGGDIYALDITTGKVSPDMFKWETGNKYGNIMAAPRIVWLRNKQAAGVEGKWVVLVPSGYNASDISLVVLDLENGKELARIDTGAKYTQESSSGGVTTCALAPLTPDEAKNKNTQAVHANLANIDGGKAYLPGALDCDNGLGALSVFDADADGGADFVFAGDLMGNVWKFDLTGFYAGGSQAANLNDALKVAYNTPLFIAQTPVSSGTQSTRQAITAMISIDDGAYGEGSMLYFGTGRLFNNRERGLNQRESFYAVWDIPRYSKQSNISGFALPLRRNPLLAPSGAKYDFIRYETFIIPKSAVKDTKSSLNDFKELRGVKRIDSLKSSDYLSFDLAGQENGKDKAVGWIVDFPKENAFERVLNRSYSFDDVIYFPSFEPDQQKEKDENNQENQSSDAESCDPPSNNSKTKGSGGSSRFYMVNRMTGGQLEKSPFDFNHNGQQDADDGVDIPASDLVGGSQDVSKLGYSNGTISGNNRATVSPAAIRIGQGSGGFLTVTGILERAAQAKQKYDCDYNRQVIFPSTVDPKTGHPLVLSSCNRNRYRVWKQPVVE